MISLYDNLAKNTAPEMEELAEEKSTPAEQPGQARLAGLFGQRTITSGQLRRAEQRHRTAQARKATRRHRHRWMANERRVAALRGQLITLAAIKTSEGKYLVGQSPAMMKNVAEHLERVYVDEDNDRRGVEVALERYEAIVAERARQRKVRA